MSPRRGTPRRQSRRVALQVLYAVDLGAVARGSDPAGFDETFEAVCANFELPEGARAFAKELVCGVAASAAQLDACLAAHASNWRLDRMAAVDRNVLRLAAYELLHTETPASVVLDEAIELARDFGTDSSPAFVNGVLHAVAQSSRGAE